MIRKCQIKIHWTYFVQHIHFDDKVTREGRQRVDKLAAIHEYFEESKWNLPKYYLPSQYATVDEMLQNFRGKFRFRVYISNKFNRYGTENVFGRSAYSSSKKIDKLNIVAKCITEQI